MYTFNVDLVSLNLDNRNESRDFQTLVHSLKRLSVVNDVVSQWLTFITLISKSCEQNFTFKRLVMCGVQIAPTSRFYK